MLKKWYDRNVYNTSFDRGNTPLTKETKLEYEFAKYREEKITFIKFINNKLDGLVYDFKIGNKKIQEKVKSLVGRQTYVSVSLEKYMSIENKKKLKTPYEEGDNDFYWFNGRNKKMFYVIPECILIMRGYISTETFRGKTGLYLTKNEKWINNYAFEYDTINDCHNKNRLLTLINDYDKYYDKYIKK